MSYSPHKFKRQVKDVSEVTIEMWEELLLFAAELVDEHGPKAQPLLSRFEREYAAAKARTEESATARIRKLIGK